VNLWDAASSGVAPPPIPEGAADGGTTAVERTRDRGQLRAAFLHSQRALAILERERDTAWYCAQDPAMPYWELSAPLMTLIQWWMEENGRQLVHGAALGTEDGGVLLVGRGGSGKSSTSLSVLSAAGRGGAVRYGGDDYCLVDPAADPPRAFSLYGGGALTAEHARRFPELIAGPCLNVDREPADKLIVLASRRWPERMVASFPIRALVVPVIGGDGPCRVEPVERGRALWALAPSTVLQLHGAGAGTFATLAGLTRRLPTFALRLSPDPRDAPPVLADLLRLLREDE
jgi:hypothetical protein